MRLHEREIHGGTVMAGAEEKPVVLYERDFEILIEKGYDKFTVDADDARLLARKLNRLALRIEKRLLDDMERDASAIEARRAETGTGSVHESAAAKPDAQGTAS